MNTATKILAAAALSALAVVGAQAETYDGVHALSTGQSRAAVSSQGLQAARSGNVYGDSYGEGVAPIASVASRSTVHQDAVAAAHGPDTYNDAYGQGVASIRGTASRATVREAGRAAAHGDQLPL